MERKEVKVSVLSPALLLLCTAAGYISAGVDGVVAGIVYATAASILAILGFLPGVGQILYFILMERVHGFVSSHARIEWVYNVAFWVGFAVSVVISIVVLVAIVRALLR